MIKPPAVFETKFWLQDFIHTYTWVLASIHKFCCLFFCLFWFFLLFEAVFIVMICFHAVSLACGSGKQWLSLYLQNETIRSRFFIKQSFSK